MMPVLFEMNMVAIWKNASVHILINLSSVSICFRNSPSKINSGDIAVSEKTMNKLMKTSYNSNSGLWRAYPDSQVDRWDQNFVNGEYVIAYEFKPGLHRDVQSLLPKVGS